MVDLVIKFVDAILCFFKETYCYDDERRRSKLYKKKKEIVKNIWIVSGLFMLLFTESIHFVGIVFTFSMVTTFIAFMILDETYYPGDDED